MSKFTISVIGLNRLESTRCCIDAIFENSHDFHLILTNNGSTDGTKEYFDQISCQHDNVTVIHNETNEGFIPPNNKAFQLAIDNVSTYFIALNNDTIPTCRWLDMLISPMEGNQNVALTGPAGTCCSLHENMHGFDGPRYEYVEGSCLCVKVSIVKQYAPLFSDYLDFIYGDDSDLSLRMQEKGYQIQRVSFTMPHKRGETVQTQPEVKVRCEAAQARNHEVLKKRWAHYLKVRNFRFPIIVRRNYAIGDVLLTTPIVRAIKESNPLSDIYVETNTPQIFNGNKNIRQAGGQFQLVNSLTIDLNGAYESRPLTHIIKAYEEQTREYLPGLGEVKMKLDIFPSEQDDIFARKIKETICSPQDKLCVLHMDHGDWPGKNWPHEKFAELANWLIIRGFKVAAVGTKNPQIPMSVYNWTGKTTLHQLCSIMKVANLFIGVDSFPMHAAQAMNCPTIGLFGVTNAKYIMTDSDKHVGIDADPSIECSGKRHREEGKTFVNCSPDCINSISVDKVQDAVENLGVL